MKQLTQDVDVIANAVTADVELDGASAETTVVSGLFFYYSSVAAWDAAVLAAVVTTVATIAVSGSSFYYSSAAVWDVITAVDAIVDAVANFITRAGCLAHPAFIMNELFIIINLLFLHIYNTHLLFI